MWYYVIAVYEDQVFLPMRRGEKHENKSNDDSGHSGCSVYADPSTGGNSGVLCRLPQKEGCG